MDGCVEIIQKKMKIKLTTYDKGLLKFLNEEHNLLSLLYDMALLPEQLNVGTKKWYAMKGIIIGYKYCKDIQEIYESKS